MEEERNCHQKNFYVQMGEVICTKGTIGECLWTKGIMEEVLCTKENMRIGTMYRGHHSEKFYVQCLCGEQLRGNG